TTKKPPQFAHARFQILSIWNGDLRWHGKTYFDSALSAKASRRLCQRPRSSAGALRGERLYAYLRVGATGFAFASAVSRRKIVSPSFIRSSRSRAIVSR